MTAETTSPNVQETTMDMKWYVVHTYSGHENKVKTNLEKAIHSAALEDQFGQILVATEDFVEMKDGKRKTSKRKTFPSYVLIQMHLTDETRHVVQNVPGVTRFIGSGQSGTSSNLNTPMVCTYHDHINDTDARLKGTIRVQ